MKVKLTDYVVVTLTEQGKHQYRATVGNWPQADGPSNYQLCQLFTIFGPVMGSGSPATQPFVDNVLEIRVDDRHEMRLLNEASEMLRRLAARVDPASPDGYVGELGRSLAHRCHRAVLGKLDEHPQEGDAPKKQAADGLAMIASERARQRQKWSVKHDAEHYTGELAVRAAELAVYGARARVISDEHAPDAWGLVTRHETDRVQQLVIAGALIVAEIERITADVVFVDSLERVVTQLADLSPEQQLLNDAWTMLETMASTFGAMMIADDLEEIGMTPDKIDELATQARSVAARCHAAAEGKMPDRVAEPGFSMSTLKLARIRSWIDQRFPGELNDNETLVTTVKRLLRRAARYDQWIAELHAEGDPGDNLIRLLRVLANATGEAYDGKLSPAAVHRGLGQAHALQQQLRAKQADDERAIRIDEIHKTQRMVASWFGVEGEPDPAVALLELGKRWKAMHSTKPLDPATPAGFDLAGLICRIAKAWGLDPASHLAELQHVMAKAGWLPRPTRPTGNVEVVLDMRDPDPERIMAGFVRPLEAMLEKRTTAALKDADVATQPDSFTMHAITQAAAPGEYLTPAELIERLTDLRRQSVTLGRITAAMAGKPDTSEPFPALAVADSHEYYVALVRLLISALDQVNNALAVAKGYKQ
ncbi:MAG TPA: hypothetical protein VM869_35860 [Enhygromyxa sp.]|nr:hypothetical protein [Enhygromyxa sp.]